jgi:hypothetical protein
MSQEKEEEQAGRRQWTYEEFVAVHEGQLLAAAIPQRHWASIFSKLVNEVFSLVLYQIMHT